ncbi:5'-nucleotidase [Pseudomonas solani]|uniref:5'-nucleotidase n=1 Tax=Pseudomonas TaxID=286 RepID=UPI000DAA05E9|nr:MULTISPECIES: 5'-nucleotidase [unclassified Pseudomonas]MDW3710615.1 5'-nucleotidase [Pseudomonas sp. 2023EL-01195]PZE10949.1 5'-nucleotidase [Pseudomonas sp. 57B-090624]
MPYELDNRLVIGLASSALFNLEESDYVFRTEGEDAYREYQRKNHNNPLPHGVAFSFIRRLLSLNKLNPKDPPVEVILLSRNDPDTGMRVMKSIEHHSLPMTRAVFLQGRSPQNYIPALKISLFLSANETDVKQAMIAGYPAGQVLKTSAYDEPDDKELRIAFDFDGVIADDQAESVFQKTQNLSDFHKHEQSLVNTPHNPGPLAEFLKKISVIQKLEQKEQLENPAYTPVLNISIVTARNAPSHERVINTMRHWNIRVNEAFFLGGIEKRSVLEVLKPHIFFDDQRLHLDPASAALPSVHIPFGITNKKHVKPSSK